MSIPREPNEIAFVTLKETEKGGTVKDLQYYLGLPYTIEIVPDEKVYFARVLELPGCMIYADTIEQLSPMIEEAMHHWRKPNLDLHYPSHRCPPRGRL